MKVPRTADFDTIIVGGGFFGCALALHMNRVCGNRVVMLEREPELLQRASYANQARVHNGYHYPRSLLTALRCRINFPRFVSDYADCIVNDFDKYYAVGKLFSKVTAKQYELFCQRIGATYQTAPKEIQRLFNPELVEKVYVVKEYAFDAVKLKAMMGRWLRESDIEIRLNTEAQSVRQAADSLLEITCSSTGRTERISAHRVINCTYSRLNMLLVNSGLPRLYLKQELTEMALVEVPEEIQDRGITLMCGPYFSIMPFPPRGLHTLSHVRYTPHCEWKSTDGDTYMDPYEYMSRVVKKSNYLHMIKDAARYMPCLSQCRYVDSIWEIKTVLPKSEIDDSRPVLYQKHCALPNLTCVMGGKIDNIYDIIEFMSATPN